MEKSLILFDLDYTLFNTDLFKESGFLEYDVYSETTKVLEVLQGKTILGIFSEGEEAPQNEKMRKTNIDRFFDPVNINIVVSKKEAMKKVINRYKDKKIFIVDDRKDMLEIAKKNYSSVTTVWLENGPYAKAQKNGLYQPDFILKNLNELINIVL